MLTPPKNNGGHSYNEFIKIFDRYIMFNEIGIEDWRGCDIEQTKLLNEIKKFHARQARKLLGIETKYDTNSTSN